MGVDIGVCKYNPERELEIQRLELMSKLPGDEGEKYDKQLNELFETLHKEHNELEKQKIPQLHYIGYRMSNLWFRIDEFEILDPIEFSYGKKFNGRRLTPTQLAELSNDISRLWNIADDEMKDKMESIMNFLSYIIEHNLMIYEI